MTELVLVIPVRSFSGKILDVSKKYISLHAVKQFVYILLVAVPLVACLLLSGCNDNPRMVPLLARADSLMSSRPDAALQLLDSVLANSDRLSAHFVMQCSLRRLNACNKLDTVFTAAHVAKAKTLVEHFDNHGTPNEQMLAYYLLGRTYTDAGEAPQAINAYNTAADRSDTIATDCDFRTLSRVHAQTAQLYYGQLLPDYMIRHERLAMKYAEEAKDTMQYLYCYGMLAEGYDMKNQKDSALQILSEVYKLYILSGHEKHAVSLCCSMADIYRRKKDYTQAEKNIWKYEKLTGYFNEKGDIKPGKEVYYFCKGMLCLETSEKDKAEYYFRKLLGVSYTYDLKIAALDGLQQFYAKYHNKDSLVKYDHLSDSICSIAHNDIEMQKTLQVQAMYDYTRNELIANQKEREAEHFKTTLFIVCSLSVILALLFTIAYILNQNEKKSLEDRIRLLQGYSVNKSLYDSPIAQHFRQLLRANPYEIPNLNDWKELKAFIDNEIPEFREKLQTATHQLTDIEYDVCMLIKIQISSSDIARLKQCSPSYITHIRKRIYKAHFLKNGRADELDEYIMSIS